MTKAKIGRPRKYPIGQTPKQPKDPEYLKKYCQHVTKPKLQTERNNTMKYVAEQIQFIKLILQNTAPANDLRSEHT